MLESVLNTINQYLEGCICKDELMVYALSKGYTEEEINAEINRQIGNLGE